MNVLKRLSLGLAVLAIGAVGRSARAAPVRIVLLSAPVVHTVADAPLPPFRVRVERATGEPLAGVQLEYFIDDICALPAFPCPDPSEYGGFDDGASQSVLVTTGSDGTATTPVFRAGHPLAEHLPLEFHVIAYAPPQTTPGGFTISEDDAWSPIGGFYNAATTVRIEGDLLAVPALDAAHSVVLGLLLASLAAAKLRASANADRAQ